MNKRSVIVTIVSVLILACLFAFARTTTTNLGLVKPTWDENIDILVDLNANSDLIDAIFDDVSLTEFSYLDGVTSAVQTQLGLRYLKTEMDSFSELQAIISDKTLVNVEDGITATAIQDDLILKADFADEDWGDVSVSTDVVSIDDNAVTEADLKVVDSPADEDIFTYESTTGDFEWHSKAELGIGTATSITDGLIVEADLDADEEPVDNDILTFDTTGDNFSWQTPAQLGLGDMNDLVDDTTPELGGTLDHNNERATEVNTVEFNGLYDNGSSGATPTIDWQNGNYQKIATDENTLFTFSNPFVGTITIVITYGGAHTVGFDAGYTIHEEGGTELSFTETSSAVDILKVMYLGTADNYVVGVMLDVKD